MHETDFPAALTALAGAGVKFIVVGGLAAVLNGAPVNTFDLDIVPARDEANISSLLSVLEAIDAFYRFQPERRLRPSPSHLSSSGHNNLATACGPIDVLGTIGRGLTYEKLLPHCSEMDIGEGVRVRVLNLDKLIEIKEELGGDKDRASLPILRHTLEQQRR